MTTSPLAYSNTACWRDTASLLSSIVLSPARPSVMGRGARRLRSSPVTGSCQVRRAYRMSSVRCILAIFLYHQPIGERPTTPGAKTFRVIVYQLRAAGTFDFQDCRALRWHHPHADYPQAERITDLERRRLVLGQAILAVERNNIRLAEVGEIKRLAFGGDGSVPP